jgi:hypothetical protein
MPEIRRRILKAILLRQKNAGTELGVVVHTCSPSYSEGERGSGFNISLNKS